MENKKIRCGMMSKLRGIVKRTVILGFVSFIWMLFIADNIEWAGIMLAFVVTFSVFYENVMSVAFDVTAEGVTFERLGKAVTCKFSEYKVSDFRFYDRYYLKFKHKDAKKNKRVCCLSFSEKEFSKLYGEITKKQGELEKKDAPKPAEKSKSAEKIVIYNVSNYRPDLTKRNLKVRAKFSGSSGATPSNPAQSNFAQNAASQNADSQPATPPLIMPAIPLGAGSATSFAANPDCEDDEQDLRRNARVFNYPSRDVTVEIERATTIKLFCGVALTFVILMLLAILSLNGGFQLNIGVAISLTLLLTAYVLFVIRGKRSRVANLHSKLVISDNCIVIDNDRYNFSEMSDMTMTSKHENLGMRSFRFMSDGMPVICSLGPARRMPGKIGTLSYFREYGELYDLLKTHGFR